jgi:hypothetical protein
MKTTKLFTTGLLFIMISMPSNVTAQRFLERLGNAAERVGRVLETETQESNNSRTAASGQGMCNGNPCVRVNDITYEALSVTGDKLSREVIIPVRATAPVNHRSRNSAIVGLTWNESRAIDSQGRGYRIRATYIDDYSPALHDGLVPILIRLENVDFDAEMIRELRLNQGGAATPIIFQNLPIVWESDSLFSDYHSVRVDDITYEALSVIGDKLSQEVVILVRATAPTNHRSRNSAVIGLTWNNARIIDTQGRGYRMTATSMDANIPPLYNGLVPVVIRVENVNLDAEMIRELRLSAGVDRPIIFENLPIIWE